MIIKVFECSPVTASFFI